jgi:hypothetical protein
MLDTARMHTVLYTRWHRRNFFGADAPQQNNSILLSIIVMQMQCRGPASRGAFQFISPALPRKTLWHADC